eukprot:scaffold535_cov65-Cylindrotheca_fusiformis.AAC.6
MRNLLCLRTLRMAGKDIHNMKKVTISKEMSLSSLLLCSSSSLACLLRVAVLYQTLDLRKS